MDTSVRHGLGLEVAQRSASAAARSAVRYMLLLGHPIISLNLWPRLS
jgi:phosphopantothenate synthetase